MKAILWIFLMLVVAVLAGFAIWNSVDRYNAPDDTDTGNGSATSTSDLIRVREPEPQDTIESPIVVSGEARGNWYFEASFPVRVLDANGKELGIGIAQAQGEWMTTEFVPFTSRINFSSPTTETGTVVFQKDNPSGLPENDAQIRVPVRFGNVSTRTRDIKLYFYNSQNDRDASGNILCSEKGLVTVNRSIAFSNTPIQDAIRQLLQGPDSVEKLTAPDTEFPLAEVELKTASLSNGILTLNFSDPDNKTSGGSCRVAILRAQIEATAKQFGGVSSVRFAPIGVFEP